MEAFANFFDYIVHFTDHLVNLIHNNADYAHWIIFGALMLAGFNVPISEDLMLIISGVLASTVVPENTTKLFLGVFLGCYLSDWEAYWLGRLLGPKLWEIKWFSKMVPKERFEQVSRFYDKRGFLVLLIGRFIPFGVRNALFITAGMMKMHFGKFILSDGIACLISNSTLFYLAYTVGKNYDLLLEKVKTFNILIFSIFLIAITAFLIRKIWIKKKSQLTMDVENKN
ncbi:MAG: putative rane protein [Chlamydiales bacterium]|jgi:membrane protein DedA with SNARE-associated domain|nr:putative rane protein [Chlamydiales bacterium]